ncbi:SUR7 protein [Diaporthe helianthi]|uniref:SUR7 protein n=1 Tax=Diaporthe helianthi TaxID=158607 RepID=A0A2P5I7H4_DIAHE|nr:SUR7 protein [Diaporthe helianthi]
MKFSVGLPLVFSMAAFALALVALLAGKEPGTLEEYHIVLFNTSTLGHDFISNMVSDDDDASSASSSTTTSPTPTSTDDSGGIGDWFSSIKASATAIAGSLESEAASILDDIGNDIADKLAEELGIEQFYSLHVMNMCEGSYAPNATASNARQNVTNCTTPMDFSYMNISAMLDKELSVGPLNISISDLGITDELQDKLDDLPKLFQALAIIYILGVAFSGLAILAAAAALFIIPSGGRKIPLANFLIAALAMLFLLVGSLLTTVGVKKAQEEIKKRGGDEIGLEVELGSKFEALSWAAFALMALAMFYWVYETVAAHRRRRTGAARFGGRRRAKNEKYSMDSYRSGRRH